MKVFSGAVLGFALAVGGMIAFTPGCGNGRPPPASDGTGVRPGGGTNRFGDTGGIAPPGCGVEPDGSQCDCVDVPLFVDPPTIYFVLDRSGSMAAGVDKWNQIRVVVGKIMRGLGPRANFGAALFPGPSANDACAAGAEIMSIRPGDPPSSSVDGPTTTTLLTATRLVPAGGTPTGATLVNVRASLLDAPGKKYVIVATDGAPNCNFDAICAADQCQPNIESLENCAPNGPNCCEDPRYRGNCNDANATLRAIEDLRSAGIPVYIVGLPGASTYARLLDDMAIAGGTALPTTPRYFAVDTATEALMLATLKKIAAKITGTCSFDLKEVPSNASLVNVYLDDTALPYEPVNGWRIEAKTVTLLGTACERVRNGDVLAVRIIAGCPRIEPR